MAENKIVESKVYPLKELFADKFDVDFYQREYVWQKKQIEDLMMDLSREFLKNWKEGDSLQNVVEYDPYYMGEIVLSLKSGQRSAIIDGQQRITTLTLLLIYLLRTYQSIKGFPVSDVEKLIYSDYYGQQLFNLDIPERKNCMLSLYQHGEYKPTATDSASVYCLVERYSDIEECWDSDITADKILSFVYWIKEKIVFSKVWTNSDEFAYVIFETMNDRGLSLTQVEMLRSYILSNINEAERKNAMERFDAVVERLSKIKLTSKSKAELEFFKLYLRGHYVNDSLQSKNTNSDFARIGREFHRWVRDNHLLLGLKNSSDFSHFLDKITYFVSIYEKINNLVQQRNTRDYLYLIVNSDYGFTLQPALIMASVCYNDSSDEVNKKIQIVSKYLTKILSWRVWNNTMISQSSMESIIYELCKKVRNLNSQQLSLLFTNNPVELSNLEGAPILNRQNKRRLKVLLALITEIVAKESESPDYMLNKKDIEIEHIWHNHFENFKDVFSNEAEFSNTRNNIGGLLVLPKSFNASYGDNDYKDKLEHYFSQNILAQTLNVKKYQNNPAFLRFVHKSKLPFKSYEVFTKNSIGERAELYKSILLWNWQN